MKITHNSYKGYGLNIAQTTKFKTVKIQVVFSRLFQRDDVTKRAMVPYLLRAISETYPTRRDMQIQLEKMYGASLSSGVKKTGLLQELTFDLTIIHNHFVIDGTNVLEAAFAFLGEILFHPLFDESIFVEEKRLLEEYFLSIYANKMRYSFQQLRQSMFADELYHLDGLGCEEDLASLSLKDCIQAYTEALDSDRVSISVVGDVDATEITGYIDQYLPFTPRTTTLHAIDQSHKSITTATQLVEQQQVKQAKFVWGYQFPVYYLEEDYYAAVVFSMMLGGHAESILFKRIREELNKVYFIGSSYDQYKGNLFVYAGINESDYAIVSAEIESIITSILDNTFDNEVLEIAKTVMISNFYQSLDSSASICARIHHLAMFNKVFQPAELVEKIQQVQRKDIALLASKLTLDTTFLLKGDTHE